MVGAPGEDSAATGVDPVAPALDHTDNSAPDAGAAYAFSIDPMTNTFTATGYLKASNTDAGDQFGFAISCASGCYIGAPGEDGAAVGYDNTLGTPTLNQADNSAPDAGAVYGFQYTYGPNAYVERQYMKATNSEAGDQFGKSVFWLDTWLYTETPPKRVSRLAVGAPGEASAAPGVGGNQADNTAAGAGAVYLY